MNSSNSSDDPVLQALAGTDPALGFVAGTDPALGFDAAPTHDFEALSAGGKIVIIRFGDVCYELKRTRSNRLVLNK